MHRYPNFLYLDKYFQQKISKTFLKFWMGTLPCHGCKYLIFFTSVILAFTCVIFRKKSRAKKFFSLELLKALFGFVTGVISYRAQKSWNFHAFKFASHAKTKNPGGSCLLLGLRRVCSYVIWTDDYQKHFLGWKKRGDRCYIKTINQNPKTGGKT